MKLADLRATWMKNWFVKNNDQEEAERGALSTTKLFPGLWLGAQPLKVTSEPYMDVYVLYIKSYSGARHLL